MQEIQQPFLISVLPPSQAQKLAALVVALLLLALFLAVLPFAHVRLAQLNVFLPMASTIMVLNDAITATLLYAHFAVLRSRALLGLASGYLFTALVIIPYALTFPGAFAPGGLLGAGLQTSPWLFSAWHAGLPATIIAYALLRRLPAGMQQTRGSVLLAILASLAAVAILMCSVTWFTTVHENMLPVLVASETDPGGIVKMISTLMLTLCATAFALLLFSPRSILDLWLLIVALAWLLSSILVNLVGARFDVAWYANRIFAIAAACFVLFVLLSELTMLYARLALSVLAQSREREARLMSMDAATAAIAHEVNQPLAAIVTNASAGLRWLERAQPDLDEARGTFKNIAAAGHRASEVIQSIRAMFNKAGQAGAPFDANDLIRETIAIARSELDGPQIAVRLELAAQLPLVSAHRGQLQQVLLNLVNNAADAMRTVTDRPRVLTVKSKAAADRIVLSVEDSGTGIEAKNIDRIFNAFFTTKADGMGMGLAICRSIVEAHGGTLSVLPGAPHGSVFQVVLPGNP